MVIGGFPAAKLGALLLRQISKPLANYIMDQAKRSPVIRTYICMPPAQFYNWCEVKTKMWILNLGKPVKVPVLSEAMAIELGANLLGEAVIFVIASSIVLREYVKSSNKEHMKETQRQQEMEALNENVKDLFFQVQQQHTQIRELLREVYALQGKKVPEDPKKQDPKTPPPGPLPPPGQLPSPATSVKTVGCEPKQENIKNANILLNIVSSLEDELFNEPSMVRQQGFLTVAINYWYKDVYKVPLTMY